MIYSSKMWVEATATLTKLAEDASSPPSLTEPEDVRRLRRLRDFLSRLFQRSRSMKTISVIDEGI